MDLASLFRLCRRHVIVLALAVLVGAGFVAVAVSTAPPLYRATGSNVLLPPQPAPDGGGDEPEASDNLFVRLGDLSLVVDIVVRRLQGVEVETRVAAAGFDGDFVVTGNSDTRRGPIFDLTATAGSEGAALDGLDVLLREQYVVLQDLQVGNADEDVITASVVVSPSADTRLVDGGVVYDATSTVLLVPPTPRSVPTVPVEQTDNPYFRLNDLSVVVDIIKRVMLSAEIDELVRAEGLAGDYLVAANTDFYRGPIIDMVVETDDPGAAIDGVKILLVEQARVLDDLQAVEGTDPAYRITTQIVIAPAEATRVLSSTLRRGLAAAILAGGFVLACLLIADLVRSMRSRRSGVRVVGPSIVLDDDLDLLEFDAVTDRSASINGPSDSSDPENDRADDRSSVRI